MLVIAVAAAYLVAQASGGTASAPTLTPAPAASSTAEPTMARRIDGIPCNDENIGYHVHAHLQILLRGREVAVPANIGIDDNTCVYYLHTHDNSGELHLEAPTYRRFTLGNFFDIWGQTLSRRHIGTIPIKPGETIRVYVDGKVYRGDPRLIQLVAHRLIALEIGPPFVKPSGFDFQGD